MRNARGQTIVPPFSVRWRPHAPVSMPLGWDEVSPRLNPDIFNIRTAPSGASPELAVGALLRAPADAAANLIDNRTTGRPDYRTIRRLGQGLPTT